LDRLNPTFCQLYPEGCRPSIPPEQLLLALLLQAIYVIRSERMLIDQLDYNLLFSWFVGLNPDDPVWHPTSFTKNRDRLLNEELIAKFLNLLLATPEVKPLLSSKHFSVDGTLLRAWVSNSSLERIDGLENGPPPPSGGKQLRRCGKKRAKGDFRGLLLSNQTHRSTSDGEARMFKKAPGVGAFLSFMGHCIMENRNGLVVASEVSQATGRAEREAASGWLDPSRGLTRKPSEPIRVTTPGSSWLTCASVASRPMWLRTRPAAVDQRLMAALLAIRATPNRSTPGSGSNRSLAGSNSQRA
jgi:transposase